ncbi:F0F1 ATP synthase subunit epsilon [Rhizobium halophytocola]|uniref:ATP synthase epsilon chain n=1 Tax=Rhizobium halophytocola TaxID=735519 RepID=A0ABS4E2R8_9HYPH|nr:F0F1 ATP synthase subunit epsilon [Rhizobium halophytocola]MBP1852233.1 F-type H+-transporting ATPase subunit epsilon [Rhizobium halophytocola]
MAENFNFELVSPERLLLSEEVSEVVIPGTEGEMTVMAKHAPTMTTIMPGVVRVKTAGGERHQYVVFGGFADILPSGCTILAESAVAMSDVNRDTLVKRIEQARADLEHAESDEDRTQIERFIDQLTHLNHTILPA